MAIVGWCENLQHRSYSYILYNGSTSAGRSAIWVNFPPDATAQIVEKLYNWCWSIWPQTMLVCWACLYIWSSLLLLSVRESALQHSSVGQCCSSVISQFRDIGKRKGIKWASEKVVLILGFVILHSLLCGIYGLLQCFVVGCETSLCIETGNTRDDGYLAANARVSVCCKWKFLTTINCYKAIWSENRRRTEILSSINENGSFPREACPHTKHYNSNGNFL